MFKKRIFAAVAAASVVIGLAVLGVAGADGPSLVTQASAQSCTTDTGGYCTVRHGLGAVPSSILLTPTINSGGVSYMLSVVAGQVTATSVKVRAMRASTNPLANASIQFSMLLYGTVATPTTTTAPTMTMPPVTTTTAPPPPPAGHPNAASTGVPVGVSLTTVNGDLQVNTAGQVVDGKHITGNMLVCADNVVIKNSQIDGVVANYTCGGTWHSFTITDSTVGPPSGCVDANTAVAGAAFTATRVHVRNVSDGFGVSASGANTPITVQDSLIELCATTDSHSDGIQLYLAGSTPVHFVHNTVNQLPCSKAASFPASWPCTTDAAQTAPIFVSDGSDGIDARDNLLIGGSSTIRVGTSANPVKAATVTGNAVVNNAWIYGAVDSTPCSSITWSNNRLVTVDASYQETSTVGPLACGP